MRGFELRPLPGGDATRCYACRGGVAIRLDDTDLEIIAALQEDGRRTYGEIGELVGLSEPAARQRVHRLREAEVLRIIALTDPVRLGLRTVAQSLIRVDGDVKDVARRLASIDSVEYVVVVTGSVDLMIEIVCEDEQRLFGILNEDIRSIPGVRDTETLIVLHIEKQVFSWGARAGRDPSTRGKADRRRARRKDRRTSDD